MAKPDLEKVVVQTLLWNLYSFGSLFQRKALLFVVALLAWSTVKPPPFKHLVNNVPDSAFFCPSAFTSFGHLIDAAFLFVLTCPKCVLESHQPVDHWNSKIFGLYGDELLVFEILRSNFYVIVDRVDSAVHVKLGLFNIKVDLFVWIARKLLYKEKFSLFFRSRRSFLRIIGLLYAKAWSSRHLLMGKSSMSSSTIFPCWS